ncbi:protease SohB [Pasteurella dagmatis]|uniref:Putative signal peptide peptidase SppA, 36K type n=1 Tax=Pasteurella dagmatis ATCC 43325 TaxID=667128 RepID=C9PQY8_9PAST|nr:protease SohB [Pasteurella dagmatis]EEX49889.1 putative signal peptide peptidase SppA, 36K type [Pasteurella dagmatis ATCC 43325]SNV60176.1 protease SohB [Pasteurella dagmatis]
MWSEIAVGYGIFILEILTILLVILGIILMIFTLKQHKKKTSGELSITDLSTEYEDNTQKLRNFHLSEDDLKDVEKAEKKAEKEKIKVEKEKRKRGEFINERKPHLYVLNFKGDISASETTALREEISAIIGVAQPEDEVLLRLESPGGVVHGYGLAASQLARLKKHNIKLTIAVDKVAASGGYMMACVADKIVAAPFAILGSVGVVAQIPNIHRLLKKHDVDVDVMTAGEYKRTVTLLGENTEKGKQKFQQELEETHDLFKQFVAQNRPHLDVNKIATGEHWFGQQALELNLVDEIATSDDLILDAIKTKKVVSLKYQTKKSLIQKIGMQAEESVDGVLLRWLSRNNRQLL